MTGTSITRPICGGVPGTASMLIWLLKETSVSCVRFRSMVYQGVTSEPAAASSASCTVSGISTYTPKSASVTVHWREPSINKSGWPARLFCSSNCAASSGDFPPIDTPATATPERIWFSPGYNSSSAATTNIRKMKAAAVSPPAITHQGTRGWRRRRDVAMRRDVRRFRWMRLVVIGLHFRLASHSFLHHILRKSRAK